MNYSYYDFEQDTSHIISEIKKGHYKYDRVVSVMRGGLPLGVCISHALNIPLDTLKWSTRDFPECDLFNLTMRSDERILLVDDICDSGKTLKTIKENFANSFIHTAVLVYNGDQEFVPEYYGYKISRKENPKFIDFWWEKYK